MVIYVALLRGINVSGQKIIKMEELKRSFESLRYNNVTTYIQSGNVVFRTKVKSNSLLQTQIENKISRDFGYKVPVIVKSLEEIEKTVKRNPFKNVKTEKGEKLHVSFLSRKPARNAGDSLAAVNDDIDEIRLLGSEVYLLCRNGYGNTLFSNTFIEKKLAVSATTRNWATVEKLLSLGKAVSDV